jgi:predicted RNA-binding Zn ribbon-like protein
VAFLNTLYVPDGADELADERAVPWLSRWLDEDEDATTPAASAAILHDLRELREGLRNLLAPVDSLEPGAEVARADAIARAAAVLRERPVVVELGRDWLVPGLTTPDGPAGRDGLAGRAIAAVATAYLNIRAGGGWARLKVCADPTCRWAFLDTSRNRSRRWCDMSGCGNRAKNRVWRERERSRTTIE